MSRKLIRMIAASVAMLAVAITMFTGAGVPSAAAALPDPYAVTCESGESQFVCDANFYSESYAWKLLPVSGSIHGYITRGQGTATIWGNCTGGKHLRVSLNNTYQESVYCNSGPWK